MNQRSFAFNCRTREYLGLEFKRVRATNKRFVMHWCPPKLSGRHRLAKRGRLQYGITGRSQGIDGAIRFINAPDGGNRALARFAALVAEGLNELSVGVGSRPSELDEHGRSVANCKYIANTLSQ